MEKDAQTARCPNCRGEVPVPGSFADGDVVKCRACNLSLRVARAEQALRLHVADVAPLRDALRENQRLAANLEADLARARASFGIGVNGLGLGVLYVVVQIALEDQALERTVVLQGLAIALVSGVLLELANFLFLAKRQAIKRLARDLDEIRSEGRDLQRKLRDAARK